MDYQTRLREILNEYHQRSCYEFRRSEVARDQSTLDSVKRNMDLYTEQTQAAITALNDETLGKDRPTDPEATTKRGQDATEAAQLAKLQEEQK